MPKQFKLNPPKKALLKPTGASASQKLSRTQALSQLRLIQKDLA